MGLFTKKHSIGKTIAALRKEKGWTQVELAEKLQVSDKAVSKWEKEDAFPSVEFFPALAELFDVSIDYLMTGKNPKKEVVVMSKAELCAKNDDVAMLESINVNTKDENGKTVLDYAKQYQSKKVIGTIIQKYGFDVVLKRRYSPTWESTAFADALYYALWTDNLSKLISVIGERSRNKDEEFYKMLSSITEKELSSTQFQKVFDLLISDTTIDDSIYRTLFGKRTTDILLNNYPVRFCKPVWDVGLLHLMEVMLRHKKIDFFDECFQYVERMNEESLPFIQDAEKNFSHYGDTKRQALEIAKQKHPLIGVSKKIIEILLESGDIKRAERMHLFNKHYNMPSIEDDTLRLAKLKADKKIDADELAVQATIHNGIICIKELTVLKNFKAIKNAILEYPIHELELICAWIEKKDLRTLFRYAVDNNLSWMKDWAIKGKIDAKILKTPCNDDRMLTGGSDDIAILNGAVDIIDNSFVASLMQAYWKPSGINQTHFYYVESGRRKEIFSLRFEGHKYPKTLEEALLLFKLCKQRVIDELALKMDKEKTTGELTREYFEKLLAKGDIDMLIIKLCVRLEAILRCDYHYEGDFSKMIDRYCSTFNTYDDEDNNYDPHTPRLLHKLRMRRNSIVHSEKNGEDLTVSELRECIEHICRIG